MTTTSSRAKLDRARRFLDEAFGIASEWAKIAAPEVEIREVGDDLHFILSAIEEPPATIAVVLGDLVHNARSALDHIACELVTRGGGTIRTTTQFPILRGPVTPSPQQLRAEVERRLKGARSTAIDEVIRMEPFAGGAGELLWQAHELDVADKHQDLLVAAIAFAVSFDTRAKMLWRMQRNPPPGGVPASIDDMPFAELFWNPLEKNIDVGGTMCVIPKPPPGEPRDFDPRFQLAVAIDAPSVGIARLHEILPPMLDAVDGALTRLERI